MYICTYIRICIMFSLQSVHNICMYENPMVRMSSTNICIRTIKQYDVYVGKYISTYCHLFMVICFLYLYFGTFVYVHRYICTYIMCGIC